MNKKDSINRKYKYKKKAEKDRKMKEKKMGKNNRNNIPIKKLDLLIKKITTRINEIKIERKKLPEELKTGIKSKIKIADLKNTDQKCDELMGFRNCAFCECNTVCNKCDKCKNCKKHLSYYKGLDDIEIIKYKVRIRVEHFISHYKHGRTSNVKDRKIEMLKDTVYNRYTDFIFIKKDIVNTI